MTIINQLHPLYYFKEGFINRFLLQIITVLLLHNRITIAQNFEITVLDKKYKQLF